MGTDVDAAATQPQLSARDLENAELNWLRLETDVLVALIGAEGQRLDREALLLTVRDAIGYKTWRSFTREIASSFVAGVLTRLTARGQVAVHRAGGEIEYAVWLPRAPATATQHVVEDAANDGLRKALVTVLAPYFGREDAYIGLAHTGWRGSGRCLRYTLPLDPTGGHPAVEVGGVALAQSVAWMIRRHRAGYGYMGRRVMPLARQLGGQVEAATRLEWWTPWSWELSIAGRCRPAMFTLV